MKLDLIALAVAAAGSAAALAGCRWLLATYAPGLTTAALFIDADIIARMMMLLIMLLTFPIMVLGVVGLLVRSAAAPMAMVLRLAGAACALLGLFGAAYGWMNVQTAISRVGPVQFAVTAPSYAEVLLVSGWGLFIAAIALAFAVGARLRAGPRLKAPVNS